MSIKCIQCCNYEIKIMTSDGTTFALTLYSFSSSDFSFPRMFNSSRVPYTNIHYTIWRDGTKNSNVAYSCFWNSYDGSLIFFGPSYWTIHIHIESILSDEDTIAQVIHVCLLPTLNPFFSLLNLFQTVSLYWIEVGTLYADFTLFFEKIIECSLENFEIFTLKGEALHHFIQE